MPSKSRKLASSLYGLLLMYTTADSHSVQDQGPRTPRHGQSTSELRRVAKPYGAEMSEHQALRALEFEISRKLGAIVQVSDYPEEARRNGWTGTTLVGVVVGADARIKAA